MEQPTFHTHQVLIEGAVLFLFLDRFHATGVVWGAYWAVGAILLVLGAIIDIGSRQE